MSYAGDVSPAEAWKGLSQDPKAVLIDVRTQPEWSFVGVPDLRSLGKKAAFLCWQVYPQMQVDPDFVAKVEQMTSGDKSAPLYFICRSGARSRSAAQALTAAGYSTCFNVAGGFEGDIDSHGHRGGSNGWKASNLPWVQQ
ncbi:MAG TPA: rhodanese-like domain-containing protein [Dongiaceae bacterium]|nr:rhodanese-like domain-containing protein [Dongiaceae bacterium]